MEPSLFLAKERPPAAGEAEAALGGAAPLWVELEAAFAARFHTTGSWAWSGKQYGWSHRLSQGKRALVYLTPCAGFVRASFALGERAVAAAAASGLPSGLAALIEQAPAFPEGRAVRIEVRDSAMVPHLMRIAELKLAG